VPSVSITAVSSDQMKLVLDLSRMLAVTTDLDALLASMAEACCRLLACDRASIWFHDPAAGELWTKVAVGSPVIRIPSFAGIAGTAFTSNVVLDVPDPQHDPRFDPASDRRSGYATRSLLAAPMLDSGGKPIGVIQAVNKLEGSFSPSDIGLLQLMADQAGVAVQRYRLQAVAVRAAESAREMTLARKVQEGLLPASIPGLLGLDIAGWARPASVTGGDCYDLWKMDDGRVGLLVADASGHGIAAALVVSQVRSLVRMLCDVGDCDPHCILSRVNHRLSQDLESNRFVTAFLGFIDAAGRVDWQSAGHGPIFFQQNTASPVDCMDATTTPLNAVDDLPGDAPPPLMIGNGGTLAVLSDGIFEAFNPAFEQFDAGRVVQWLDDTKGGPAAGRLDQLRSDVDDWQAGPVPTDDQTAVIVSRTAT
jgi:sigma-B regulation protein RsbU (phosphoserine phosphatase)